jgi:hypothetical protein
VACGLNCTFQRVSGEAFERMELKTTTEPWMCYGWATFLQCKLRITYLKDEYWAYIKVYSPNYFLKNQKDQGHCNRGERKGRPRSKGRRCVGIGLWNCWYLNSSPTKTPILKCKNDLQ